MGRVFFAAAAFVAAELGAGLAIGGFFALGRAEPLVFLAFRPWLILVLAFALRSRAPLERWACFALALLAAAASESLLIAWLGARPLSLAGTGLVAGALVALVVDLVVQLGRRGGRAGVALAVTLLVAGFLIPGGLGIYERIALGPNAPRPAASRPALGLVTGLPLLWGESGPLDPAGRPARATAELEREFALRPIDHLDAAVLRQVRLLLVAQPPLLAPTELVALDAWIHAGGRALILADPLLAWPSGLPPGDLRRPPATSRLDPLLAHWGVGLESGPAGRQTLAIAGSPARRLVVESPGRFRATRGPCRARGFLASCVLGRGQVLLVADADLLRDDLWSAPHARGGERHARLADNPLLISDWLDRLAGLERPRAGRPVSWFVARSPDLAILVAALPILLLLAGEWAASRLPRLIHSAARIELNKNISENIKRK